MLLAKSRLETLHRVLCGTEEALSLPDARIRDRFSKMFTELLKTFEEDRKKIYEKFCDKLEDGTPDTSNNEYKFNQDVLEELNAELATLGAEEVEFTVPEKLKEILEKSNYFPKLGETEIIDEILAKL